MWVLECLIASSVAASVWSPILDQVYGDNGGMLRLLLLTGLLRAFLQKSNRRSCRRIVASKEYLKLWNAHIGRRGPTKRRIAYHVQCMVLHWRVRSCLRRDRKRANNRFESAHQIRVHSWSTKLLFLQDGELLRCTGIIAGTHGIACCAAHIHDLLGWCRYRRNEV